MVWFKIISNEDFEDCWGGITHKGDILETTIHDDLNECKRYAYEKYGPYGENIKIIIRKIEE